jgi:hypothetical protein
MDTSTKILLTILLAIILLAGFKININSFHWEFKGLMSIIFKLITGKDL